MAALGKTVSTGLSKIGGAVKTMTSSKPGKTLATGAAVGGAVALTGAGAGIGISAASKGVKEATSNNNPFKNVLDLFNKDASEEEKEGAKEAAGTLIGIAVIVGLVLLAVFVIIPQFNKSKKGGK